MILGQGPAAVDHQHLAGDEAGIRMGEEADGVGDVMDATDTAHRDE